MKYNQICYIKHYEVWWLPKFHYEIDHTQNKKFTEAFINKFKESECSMFICNKNYGSNKKIRLYEEKGEKKHSNQQFPTKTKTRYSSDAISQRSLMFFLL